MTRSFQSRTAMPYSLAHNLAIGYPQSSRHAQCEQRCRIFSNWSGTGKNHSRTWQISVTRREGLLGSMLPCCCANCNPKDGWYDKFFAKVMATGMDAYEEAVSPVKAEILQHARNKGGGPQAVLEIGIGAAPNLQYLTSFEPVEGLTITGIDPNPYMFEYAKASVDRAGLPSSSLDLKIGSAESLPAANETFDTVICTLVLCSVPDVPASVKEIRRILKPGGKLFIIEHVVADPNRRFLRAAQRVLSPVQQVLADGCHLNRNPIVAIQNAGFSSVDLRKFDVPGMGVIAPHIAGIVTA